MKVYQAINAVQADLAKEGISKNRKNEMQHYNFRGIDDVYNALAPLLAKHGLCILPRVVSREVIERITAKGTALFYVTVGAEFDFVCASDGSKHVVSTYGEAMDSGDKATNKAMSAAYKYACMQAFAIPTEGDNDADSKTHVVISPVKASAPDPELAEQATAIADALVGIHADYEQGDAGADYAAFETVDTMDNELKLAVWAALAPHSKVRSWIKKITQEKKAA